MLTHQAEAQLWRQLTFPHGLAEKLHLKKNAKTTANGELPRMFCACVRGNLFVIQKRKPDIQTVALTHTTKQRLTESASSSTDLASLLG